MKSTVSMLLLLLLVIVNVIVITGLQAKSYGTYVELSSASSPVSLTAAAAVGSNTDHDILLRAYKGEKVERTPVWLMRQAGRYMADFRKFSEKYPFRERSETPEIAIELSLQPWKSFGVDGVIMFSDILTPLPAMGIDFTIIESKGPKIKEPIRSVHDIDRIHVLHDVEKQVPFLNKIIKGLRRETEGKTSLIGFIGAPWTLVAYSIEGGHSKLCKTTKNFCYENPAFIHSLLDKYTESLCIYASHQVDSGAQIIQIFESWSHHMSEELWEVFAKPYANRVATYLKEKHPNVPIVYFANGGSGYLHKQADMHVDALSIDWKISMSSARAIVGSKRVIAGNVDPMVLYGSHSNIEDAVKKCITDAKGMHVLNLGHGVEKDIPEQNVAAFVNAAKLVKI